MFSILPIRVYYEDTDAGGMVYHANYLKFFERGRVESLRKQGFELNALLNEHDAHFVVHSMEIEFLSPARLDQLLYVTTEVVEVRKASIRYNQIAYLEAIEGRVLCRAKVKLACLNKQDRPRGLPEILSQEIKRRIRWF